MGTAYRATLAIGHSGLLGHFSLLGRPDLLDYPNLLAYHNLPGHSSPLDLAPLSGYTSRIQVRLLHQVHLLDEVQPLN